MSELGQTSITDCYISDVKEKCEVLVEEKWCMTFVCLHEMERNCIYLNECVKYDNGTLSKKKLPLTIIICCFKLNRVISTLLCLKTFN